MTRRRILGLLLFAICALAVGISLAFKLRTPSGTPAAALLSSTPGLSAADIPAPLEPGPAVSPLIARVRAIGDAVAQARTVADAIGSALRAGGAQQVSLPEEIPPARSLDQIYAALHAHDGRVTSLDVARLAAGVLRASGASVQVAERTASATEGEPADPSGLLGSYVAITADHAVDGATSAVLSARDTRPRLLDERALVGAMLAQSALHSVASGAPRDRSLSLANAAVEAWRDGAVPLVVRSFAWRVAAGSDGITLASQDLASAIALRDEASIHLLRARLALVTGDLRTAASASSAAFARARTWGPAALASVVFSQHTETDAADRCTPLAVAREPWTDDALLLCRNTGSPSETAAAAARLLASSSDPLRLAYAAAAGAGGATFRVRSNERAELSAWLLLLGREDLAREALGLRDGG